MQVNFDTEGQSLIVSIVGRLDTVTAPEAESVMLERVGEAASVIVDLAGTEYVSSSGLRVLLKTAKAQQSRNAGFALCAANEQVLEVLEVSGFLTILKHAPTREEAVGLGA
jgi:anti-anti-sigma factor